MLVLCQPNSGICPVSNLRDNFVSVIVEEVPQVDGVKSTFVVFFEEFHMTLVGVEGHFGVELELMCLVMG